jgi:hypothetical protein
MVRPLRITRQILLLLQGWWFVLYVLNLFCMRKNHDLSEIWIRDLWVSSRQCYQLSHGGRLHAQKSIIYLGEVRIQGGWCHWQKLPVCSVQNLAHRKPSQVKVLKIESRGDTIAPCGIPLGIPIFKTEIFLHFKMIYPGSSVVSAPDNWSRGTRFESRYFSGFRTFYI